MRRSHLILGLAAVTAVTGCKTTGKGSGLLDAEGEGQDNCAKYAVATAPAGEAAIELSPEAVKTKIKQALFYLADCQQKTDVTTGALRLKGEWPSYVRGSILSDQQLTAIYDSNAFVPMFVAYPLTLLDDSALPNHRVAAMEQSVMALLNKWYVDEPGTGWESGVKGEVNFWPTFQGFHGPQQIAQTMPVSRLAGPVFNIANDADDTAIFHVTAQKLAKVLNDPTLEPLADPSPLFQRPYTLDTDRVRSDDRERQWKPAPTGAYLTWLTEENKPYNRQPIAFFLANNVDCVVVANALYAVGLAGAKSGGAYDQSCALARSVIAKKNYPVCGFYYPPKWLFPYEISRAYRDGGNDCLTQESAMDTLSKDVIAAQGADGAWDDDGAFENIGEDTNSQNPEFRGDPKSYSTALSVITLMNAGATHSADAALQAAAKKAVDGGIKFLLNSSLPAGENGRLWQGGVFFSSSFQQIARWKSRPYTTAMALEAFVKYTLDYGDPAKTGARIQLTPADVPADWGN